MKCSIYGKIIKLHWGFQSDRRLQFDSVSHNPPELNPNTANHPTEGGNSASCTTCCHLRRILPILACAKHADARLSRRSDSEICLCEPSRKQSVRRCIGKLATNLLKLPRQFVLSFIFLWYIKTQITQALIDGFKYIFQTCPVRWCMFFWGEINVLRWTLWPKSLMCQLGIDSLGKWFKMKFLLGQIPTTTTFQTRTKTIPWCYAYVP